MPVTFHIGTRGLEDRLDQSLVYSDKEFYNEELPSNVSWEHVTVHNKADMNKWLQAKNKWLSAAWTPNQTHDERDENAVIMQEQMNIMASLEIR